MFITNKRESLPSYIMVDITKIEVVSKFKLLGVTIDSKLSFVEHASLMTKSINSKLFAIKKLFNLSFDVNLLFFKTFILLFFDYCLYLIFYYSKTAICKLTLGKPRAGLGKPRAGPPAVKQPMNIKIATIQTKSKPSDDLGRFT